jgi:hypothetical protein
MPEPEIDKFDSFDEADSVEVEADLPADSYDPSAVADEEIGCEE